VGGERILIVDDNPIILKLLRIVLKGYDVRTVTGANDALEVLRWFHPQLILMDIQLRTANGLDLTRRLRVDPGLRDVTILALTAGAPAERNRTPSTPAATGTSASRLTSTRFRASWSDTCGAPRGRWGRGGGAEGDAGTRRRGEGGRGGETDAGTRRRGEGGRGGETDAGTRRRGGDRRGDTEGRG
jgi:CheY-like chemotaxis protein